LWFKNIYIDIKFVIFNILLAEEFIFIKDFRCFPLLYLEYIFYEYNCYDNHRRTKFDVPLCLNKAEYNAYRAEQLVNNFVLYLKFNKRVFSSKIILLNPNVKL
jgi:hypothetical protein